MAEEREDIEAEAEGSGVVVGPVAGERGPDDPPLARADAAAPDYAMQLVSDALRAARDEGRGLTIPELRDETALGNDDLTAAVERLRADGRCGESDPGKLSWRNPDDLDDTVTMETGQQLDEELDEGGPQRASRAAAPMSPEAARRELLELGVQPELVDAAVPVGTDTPADADDPEGSRTDGDVPAPGGGSKLVQATRAVEVRLPISIAESVDPSVLGEMVAKGVEQAKEQGQPFRLEVS